MAERFSIHVDLDDRVAVLRLGGELDLAARSPLRTEIDRLLDDVTVAVIQIDLAALTFIDSSGIGSLVGCRHAAAEVGKALLVTGARGRVAAVLDLTGVTPLLAESSPPQPPTHEA